MTGDRRVMAVTVEPGSAFQWGDHRSLLAGDYLETGGTQFDVSPDGERFLVIKQAPAQTRLHVVLNWHQELLERVPVP